MFGNDFIGFFEYFLVRLRREKKKDSMRRSLWFVFAFRLPVLWDDMILIRVLMCHGFGSNETLIRAWVRLCREIGMIPSFQIWFDFRFRIAFEFRLGNDYPIRVLFGFYFCARIFFWVSAGPMCPGPGTAKKNLNTNYGHCVKKNMVMV